MYGSKFCQNFFENRLIFELGGQLIVTATDILNHEILIKKTPDRPKLLEVQKTTKNKQSNSL